MTAIVTAMASSARTAILSLTLTHYRNYHTGHLEVPSGQSVVLVGENGAGKTNLLEAISLLTPGKGFRRAAIGDLENSEDHAPWSISAEAQGALGLVQIGTGRDPESSEDAAPKRLVRIDGKTAKSHHELAHHIAVLWLTPQMDALFTEGGTARRKFLDRLVYSFDEDHAARMHAYETAMRERNRLLSMPRPDPLWLSGIEQKLAQLAITVAAARAQTVEGIAHAMAHAAHPFPKAHMQLKGEVETLLAGQAASHAEEALQAMFARNRPVDAAAGRTLIGIHRTQMEVLHAGTNREAAQCSTGQQKALLVSLVLAQATACGSWHGRIPILLLDEVPTHLDAARRHALYDALAATRAQCWLTGTDRDSFDGFSAMEFRVSAGRVAVLEEV